MLGQLQVVVGPDQGRSFPLEDGQTLVIGRGQNAAIQLKDLQVSRVHCELQVAAGRLHLIDNGSAGGTLVNGQRVEEKNLVAGDTIRIGETTLRVVIADVSERDTLAPRPASRPAAATSSDLTGATISHYEIISVIARGHSGMIYQARDTQQNRVVAFKALGPEYTTDDEQFQRFARAVKTVLGLRHENLVAVYGAGKTGSTCWIAMEYVEGESLTKVIQRIGVANMLDWRFALKVAVQVARALDAAHQQHIIHRNVTPENILIHKGDEVAKLGDLILAKAMEGILARQVTRPGQVLGNLSYLSPERTADDATADTRSDLYSLGATAFALLTGHPPFEGRNLIETITRIRTVEPARPKTFQLSIPDQFQDIVLKCLAKRPEDRYQTPGELLRDLERVAKFQGMTI